MALKKLKWLRFILPLLGIGILVGVVRKAGAHNLWLQIESFGWRFIPIIVLSGLNYIFFTISWWLCLDKEEKTFAFSKLLQVKMIGEAVNATTPLSFAAGDPVRIYLLRGVLHWKGGTRSVVVDRTLYIMAVLIFILSGFFFFLSHMLPADMTSRLNTGLIVLVGALILLFMAQRKGLFGVALKVIDFLRMAHLISPHKRQELIEIDYAIRKAYRKGGWKIALSFAVHFLTRCVMVFETTLILYFLGSPLPFTLLWGLTAMVPLVNFVFGFLPGSLGVLEGMNGIAFYFLKIDPAIGISMQLIRRVRTLVWVVLGWTLFTLIKNKKQTV